jgi:hypothetical protein
VALARSAPSGCTFAAMAPHYSCRSRKPASPCSSGWRRNSRAIRARVVEGQRVMQTASDIFLGWTEDVASHRYFYVRHLKNRRLGSIGELVEQEALATYAHLCGRGFALVDYPEHRNSRPRLSLPQACNAVGSIGLWFMSRLHLATSAGPVLQGLASRAR